MPRLTREHQGPVVRFVHAVAGRRLLVCLLSAGICLWPLVGSAQAAAPTDTKLPAITGTPQQGQTLSYVPGTWNEPVKITDQWWRCTSPITCAQISGTKDDQATYTLIATDVGDTIEIHETATSKSAPATSATVDSAPVGPVTPLAPVDTVAPVISGSAQQGQTLSVAYNGAWTNSPTAYHYVWEDCSSACGQSPASTDSPSYTLTAADVGYQIRAEVTAANAAGPGAPASSNQTSAVVPSAPVNAAAPTITGTPQEGQTLTENPAYWTNSPTSISRQWFRCNSGHSHCSVIPSATATTYSLSSADIGATLQVTETATNAGGRTTAYSGFTSAVTNVAGTLTAPSTTSLLVSPGDPVADQTLTLVATVTSAAAKASPAGSLTFDANGTPLAGCTSLGVNPTGQSVTLTCQAAFAASTTTVTATFTPGAGDPVSGSTSSASTMAIGRAPSSLSLDAPARADLAAKTTYTATIASPAGNSGPVQPSGRVTFQDAGRPIGSCRLQPVANHTAKCTLTYLGLGKHKISVSYGGDSNFSGSSSSTRTVTVSPIPPNGYVTAYMTWTFYYTPAFTQVRQLVASELAWGTTVSLTCGGHGCPFSHRTTQLTLSRRCARSHRRCAAPKPISLTSVFADRHVGAGAQITVSIAHRGWLGKYYRFTTRSGQRPKILEACLAVNSARPGLGCT